ncbi:bifunctional pantoate--beta-alanine ligase/(d)CMP kinase [Synechococcus sp. CBW1006]|uniref:bifunctional pantoate--beta-alanine ligase/(d)CMP kinase n=1 Tax=Synechococcus sp. CBW1006 TaxID=1353138 RepID=UPI0018CFA7D9|nr:bifunctional pantoate--beta-alanine ligase/(d)CMP kinase [Synechococcus sp. CBW1006]QPN68461.1 bifunctional pantoate--beta-alanine ligase/(d)CMP kinase [Synechococcus sp. CBW1006]
MPFPLLTSRTELSRWCTEIRASGRPLHVVPTMGALHRGHQELIRRAARGGGSGSPAVLVSVFVNPLQFGAGEDFERYPRDLTADAGLAAAAGADALFAPNAEEIYPGGEAALTRIQPPAQLQASLCGRQRPGHFEGVATVVARLLALVRPDRLLLGEKDWQQLVILRRVVADLALPVTVQGCCTVREPDGLACSSRNRYLSPVERQRAAMLPVALARAAELYRSGERQAAPLLEAVRAPLEAVGLTVEYGELVEPHGLQPLRQASPFCLLAVAARCGSSRLIDHTFLMSRPPIVAIDGPAGAGKSTVTRAFAQRLGLLYLDTGAMYRALTWWVQRQGLDLSSLADLAPQLQLLDLQLSLAEDGSQRVKLDGQDVTEAIRSPAVTALVSQVAAQPCVRNVLTRQQQALGRRGGLVAEGRDIGTAVFPDAELKVFLTATPAERARRRALDLEQRGFAVPPLAELEAQIAERDHLDSTRAVAPLLQAEDAVALVTDGLTIEAVIQRLVDLFRERVPEDAWPAPAEPLQD